MDSDGIIWDKSARLRILLDVTKPLRRVQRVALKDGSSALIEIKYERLPTFCYMCGRIGHIERDCLMASEENKEDEKQWGSWIRASPRRGRQRIEEETKVFLKGARVLDFIGKVAEVEGNNIGREEEVGVVQQNLAAEDDDTVQVTTTFSHQHIESGRVIVGEGCEHSKELEWISPPRVHGDLLVEAMQVPLSLDGKSSPFMFEAGEGKAAKKLKKTNKTKTSSKKQCSAITVDAHFEICNELDVGEKRKLVDNMLVDDEVAFVESGSKKQKLTETLIEKQS
ncbi:hypothetical protein BVRB_9g220580 [Beta vulgaris subsp. vulgaris]|nr:hypothetical protein BVRB_9g220580 [Beta vulgaris subsp. vulgaris]